jgi:hypothetical protein
MIGGMTLIVIPVSEADASTVLRRLRHEYAFRTAISCNVCGAPHHRVV